MKKQFSAFITFAAVAALSRLNAEMSVPIEESTPNFLVQEPSSSKSSTPERKNAWPMFDPHAMPDSHGFWLDGELLFWKANVGSLDYGIESKSTTTVHGSVKHPHFNWDWGFRLGLGYKLPYDKWDLFLNYTYVQGRAHGHAGNSDKVVFPSWASGFNTNASPFYADKAHAHWWMTLNMPDIELGRNCFIGKWLTIRPFLGLRGLVIDQDYHITYIGGTVAPSDRDKVHLDTDFWGIGVRMGFNSLWGLGKGFGVYGNGSASLLSGHFDVDEHEKLQKARQTILNVDRDIDNVVVTADLALGLQWDYMFSRNNYHFGLKFGWEFNLFFDQNQLFNFLSSSNPGAIQFLEDDLSFQGLTLGMRFDF